MVSPNRIALCSLTLAVALIAAGCASTKPEAPAPAPAEAPAAPTPPPSPATEPVKTVEAPAMPLDPLNDPKGKLAQRSVYFDFDLANIRSDYEPLITAHGDYLGLHHDRHIVIQGNCDERGSHEYNLALGQRRSDAVKERLLLLGTLDDQVETISFGKEKPRAVGHDEQAWAQNRRADLVYK